MTPLAACRHTLLLIACATQVAGAQGEGAAPAPSAPPTLVVLITIDQFRADYLTRFGHQLTGGLARLARGGAWFTDAHHDHAITETAPGHATLLAGRFPRSTGIAMNSVGVADEKMPLIAGGLGTGASPRRFIGTTLVDWLRAADPRSLALSVSVKDRGAILPVGRSKSDVYWYSPDGQFTTSRYYRETLPAWVTTFNARRLPQRFAGRAWTLLLPESAYPERDSVFIEGAGAAIAFPHRLPADSAEAASLVRVTPFIDEITVAFALDGVRALALGTGPQTDVLAVSLSSTDYVGHGYGPDSREMHDQVLRADRTIGVLLDSLYRLRDSSRVLVVLTSDHGVASIPELAAESAIPRARRVDFTALSTAMRARLRSAGVTPDAVEFAQELILVDRRAFKRSELSVDDLIDEVAAESRRVPGVRRVDGFRVLLADSLTDKVARRWSHQLSPDAPVALVVTLDSGSTWEGNVAPHGSTYDYDSRVPLIFAGAGIRPGQHAEFVRTVDIAPTLAAAVGVKPMERLDGVVLWPALPEARRAALQGSPPPAP
jgi:predicted AlkP superfamily pyrophosphatase or phosphodiesterase